MERLTEWNNEHTSASVKYHSDYIIKLAEYEDLEEKLIENIGMKIEEFIDITLEQRNN